MFDLGLGVHSNIECIFGFFAVRFEDCAAFVLKEVLKLWIDKNRDVILFADLDDATNDRCRNYTLVIIFENDTVKLPDVIFDRCNESVFGLLRNVMLLLMIDAKHVLRTCDHASLDSGWAILV